MPRENFNELLSFLAVAEERSFTKAAARLGIAQSTLSYSVKQLEARMGLHLLIRTSRSVKTTEEGKRLQQSLAPRVSEIEADIEALRARQSKAAGAVRITLCRHAMESVVWPKLSPILASYPDIKLEFSITTDLGKFAEDDFDARVRLGKSCEKDMLSVRIGPPWRLVAVGSPAYFAAQTTPKTLEELLNHNCINRRFQRTQGLYAWEFEKNRKKVQVKVTGQLTFNTDDEMINAALDGHGIAFVPESYVERHLADSRLKVVLADWSPKFAGYYLHYPSRRQNLSALSVVVDSLRE